MPDFFQTILQCPKLSILSNRVSAIVAVNIQNIDNKFLKSYSKNEIVRNRAFSVICV